MKEFFYALATLTASVGALMILSAGDAVKKDRVYGVAQALQAIGLVGLAALLFVVGRFGP